MPYSTGPACKGLHCLVDVRTIGEDGLPGTLVSNGIYVCLSRFPLLVSKGGAHVISPVVFSNIHHNLSLRAMGELPWNHYECGISVNEGSSRFQRLGVVESFGISDIVRVVIPGIG